MAHEANNSANPGEGRLAANGGASNQGDKTAREEAFVQPGLWQQESDALTPPGQNQEEPEAPPAPPAEGNLFHDEPEGAARPPASAKSTEQIGGEPRPGTDNPQIHAAALSANRAAGHPYRQEPRPPSSAKGPLSERHQWFAAAEKEGKTIWITGGFNSPSLAPERMARWNGKAHEWSLPPPPRQEGDPDISPDKLWRATEIDGREGKEWITRGPGDPYEAPDGAVWNPLTNEWSLPPPLWKEGDPEVRDLWLLVDGEWAPWIPGNPLGSPDGRAVFNPLAGAWSLRPAPLKERGSEVSNDGQWFWVNGEWLHWELGQKREAPGGKAVWDIDHMRWSLRPPDRQEGEHITSPDGAWFWKGKAWHPRGDNQTYLLRHEWKDSSGETRVTLYSGQSSNTADFPERGVARRYNEHASGEHKRNTEHGWSPSKLDVYSNNPRLIAMRELYNFILLDWLGLRDQGNIEAPGNPDPYLMRLAIEGFPPPEIDQEVRSQVLARPDSEVNPGVKAFLEHPSNRLDPNLQQWLASGKSGILPTKLGWLGAFEWKSEASHWRGVDEFGKMWYLSG